ncbi:hypothetical protein PRIC2_009466 [Phytophthora ramorum]
MPSNSASRARRAAIAAVASILASGATHAAHIYLYDGPNVNGYYLDWAISETQCCYSVPCFNDRTHSLKFRKLPNDSHLALYEKAGCQGKHYKVPATPHGTIKYADGGFSFGISSFMIWSSGIYATNGLVNICEESAKLLDGNITGNVESII